MESNLTFSVGWGGWLEIWRVRLTSAKVEVEAEPGKNDENHAYLTL